MLFTQPENFQAQFFLQLSFNLNKHKSTCTEKFSLKVYSSSDDQQVHWRQQDWVSEADWLITLITLIIESRLFGNDFNRKSGRTASLSWKLLVRMYSEAFNEEFTIYIRDKKILRLCQSFDSSFVSDEEFSQNLFLRVHGVFLRGAADVTTWASLPWWLINYLEVKIGTFLFLFLHFAALLIHTYLGMRSGPWYPLPE